MYPLVSVVIPCYKQAQYLSFCIQSVLDQQRSNVEIVVVDDGSPDNTAEVARTFGSRIVLVRQTNRGLPAARNSGIRAARGELLMFLDADDLQMPGAIDAVIERAARSHDVDVFCGGWQDINPSGAWIADHPPPALELEPLSVLLPLNAAPPCCWAVRRRAVEAANGFNESMTLGHEDWDLWLRLASAGRLFAKVPAVVAKYRVSPASMSKNFARMYISGRDVLRRTARMNSGKRSVLRRISISQAFFRTYYLRYVVAAQFRDCLHSPAQLRPAIQSIVQQIHADPRLLLDAASTIGRRLARSRFVDGTPTKLVGVAPR